ncbi:MAG: N-succinylarginine dihydrolase [Actinobacteria bacterium]|nr:MAG: N-succinylarginine dihydrolase [Actinomycetota bacterium]
MSTNPEDQLVNVLSQWLARHVDNEKLRAELAHADTTVLGDESREAVDELRQELDERNGQGELERTVRETLEALALYG